MAHGPGGHVILIAAVNHQATVSSSATPAAVVPVLSIPTPGPVGGASVTPSAVIPVLTIPTATPAVSPQSSAVVPVLSIPTPTETASGNKTLSAVIPVLTIPAPTVLAVSVKWPTTVSANGRYIKDQNGDPWMMHGDAAWDLITNVTLADAKTYIDNRAGKGLNLSIVELMEHGSSNPNAPNNLAGDNPWTGTAFQSTLNGAYWAHADDVIDYAAAEGVTLMLFPTYLGFSGTEEGWDTEIAAASNAQMQTFGGYIGTRYKDRPNIIWCIGADQTPGATLLDRLDHFVTGLKAAGDTHLITAHNVRQHDAEETWGVYSWLDLNSVYTSDPSTIAEAAVSYAKTPARPTFLIEGKYYNAAGVTLAQVRREQWQVLLVGGIGGTIVGNEDVWPFAASPNWVTHLADQESSDAGVIAAFVESMGGVAWSALAPDLSDTFLTSGESTGTAQAAASFSSRFGLVYVPTSRSVTVNVGNFTGYAKARVRWFDPTAGTYNSSTYYDTSGTQSITHPGNNAAGDPDWVLVVEGIGPKVAVVQPVLTIPTPTPTIVSTVASTAVVPVLSIPTPTETATGAPAPPAVIPVLSIPTPSETATGQTAPSAVVPVLSIPAPSPTTAATATPAAVIPVLSVPTPSPQATTFASAAAVVPVLSIPIPAETATSSTTAAAVVPVLLVPTPSVDITEPGSAFAAAVVPVLSIPTPSPAATTFVSLSAIQPLLSVPTPAVAVAALPSAVVPALVVPTPSLTSSSGPGTGVVVLVLDIPTAGIDTTGGLSSTAVELMVVVGNPVVVVPGSASPQPVVLGVEIPNPGLDLLTQVFFGPHGGVIMQVEIPTPSIALAGVVTPGAVAPVLTIGAVGISGDTSFATVQAVLLTVVIPVPVVAISVIILTQVRRFYAHDDRRFYSRADYRFYAREDEDGRRC